MTTVKECMTYKGEHIHLNGECEFNMEQNQIYDHEVIYDDI